MFLRHKVHQLMCCSFMLAMAAFEQHVHDEDKLGGGVPSSLSHVTPSLRDANFHVLLFH
jgi:hypothetical protein